MGELRNWIPPGPVAFALVLCITMLVSELYDGSGTTASLVFYSFLPAVLWMMAIQQKRDAGAIRDLQTRLAQLQESRSGAPAPRSA